MIEPQESEKPYKDWYDVPSDKMTLEQARQAVKDLRKKLAEYLEQKPCEDAISRQAAIDVIERWLECSDYNKAERHIMRATESILYDLPSVKQEPTVDVLDKIRVELEHVNPLFGMMSNDTMFKVIFEIIDKYKAESEGNEKNKKRFENELFMMQTNIFPYKGEQE